MDGRTTFPRVSGGMVLDSFSVVSFFTGLLAVLPAGLLALLGSVGQRSPGVTKAAVVVWGLTVLVCIARFGQAGLAGDSDGGLFSSGAGQWSETLLAAARLLVLWVAWLLPFVAWVLLKAEPQATGGLAGGGFVPFGLPKVPFLLTAWSAAGMVFAFAFVAVSAAAPGFGGVFSPGLWRALFAGRLGELFVAMAGTFGPPAAVLLFAGPLVAALVSLNAKLGGVALGLLLLYLVGMILTLQGKLCGAFAAASLAEEEAVPDTGIVPSGGERSRFAEGVPARAAVPVASSTPAAAAPAAPAHPAPALRDPRSLHVVWQTCLAAGDADGALATAVEAIPAGLAKGEPKLAATIFRHHLDRLPDLGLDRNALDQLADQLLRDGDVAAAAWTFSQALESQPTDPKAFKGLLRVAEHHLEKAREPVEAVRVYRFLLARAPDSPFAGHARDLLGDAERKAARSAQPRG